MTTEPFTIAVPQQRIDWIRQRLEAAHWPTEPTGEAWLHGASHAVMRDLVGYWLEHYDWRARERWLNGFPQFVSRVGDDRVHFVHVEGKGPDPLPVIMSHGWPGSFVEFTDVIGPLTDPASHGGDPADAVSLVVPSLPGYGFSSKPTAPIGPRTIARLFDRLMVDELGYRRYVAQGGDWGSAVSSWLAYDSAACAAVHINLTIGWADPEAKPETAEEQEAAGKLMQLWQQEGGYIAIQGTKPVTLDYAMADSPLGVAAWITEKFRTWSALEDGDLWSVYSRDRIIDNLMIYLATDTFGTASWLYRGVYGEPVPPGARIVKPTGVANFPGELGLMPRSTVAKSYTEIVSWTHPAVGGHFAAMEQPAAFVEEFQGFLRVLRERGA